MLFFGLPETNGSMVTPNFASGSIQSSHVSFDPNPDPNVLSENCEEKIFQFCEKVLKIENVKASVEIDRAHRIDGRVQDKTRPIVVKFKDTRSKNIVKNSLRNVNLRDSPYNVTEQFPPEVQAKRKLLYPVMMDARKSGKKAVLVRDK